IREKMLAWLKDWLSVRETATAWLSGLFGVVERFGCAARLEEWHRAASDDGQLDLAAEHQQVWNDLCRLFDEMHDSLGNESMTARQFTESLEAGLSEFTLGLVPATL